MTNTAALAEKLGNFADAALIISPENRFYFTRFHSSDGFLLVSRAETLFFTDSRYLLAAKQRLGGQNVRDSFNIYASLQEIFQQNNIKTLAIEYDRLTIAQLSRLKEKLPGTEFIVSSDLSDAIEELRMIKSREELEKIKAAQSIAEKAFSHILNFIRPGRSEKEVALELDFYMLSQGAEALAFDTIAVSGVKSSMPHGVPDGNIIQKGDFITLDFGAVVDGYRSDMTRTIAAGPPSHEQREVYSLVLEAQKNALAALKNGISARSADAAARDIIEKAGYGKFFGHGTGHGVGVEIHESPSLSPRSDFMLKTGNVVTVEPGIYLPEKFGVRVEDMAYITEKGCENLTHCPKELIIL